MKRKYGAAAALILAGSVFLLIAGLFTDADGALSSGAVRWFRALEGVTVTGSDNGTVELQLERGLRAGQFIGSLRNFAQRYSLQISGWEATERSDQLQIRLHNGRRSLRILAVWAQGGGRLSVFPGENRGRPRIAVVLDDAGNAPLQDKFLSVPCRLSFAVMPDIPGNTAFAARAGKAGHQVLVHVPMLPLAASNYRLPGRILRPDSSPAEVITLLHDFIRQIPGAVGINNHMGSAATMNQPLMTAVMKFLEPRGLYFLDSLTSGGSVAFQTALSNGVPAAVRDIFLDHHSEYSYIQKQMKRAAAEARRKGFAVAIGHVTRSNTLAVLLRMVPLLQQEGVEFVYLSELVQ